ncbi:ATP-binding protein [Planctomicrobium sp. SH668]|uniref:ATP-binding protein n=1 Tax=Planctomicrobium sp. SH668 TaxID=3448126 RepID=UPI003F5BE96E
MFQSISCAPEDDKQRQHVDIESQRGASLSLHCIAPEGALIHDVPQGSTPLVPETTLEKVDHLNTAIQTSAQPVQDVLRQHAEQEYAHELEALAHNDDRQKPNGWKLSPWAIKTYILGGTLPDGTAISAKYVGQPRLIEIAIATLATDRALLLYGVPGTAKTWVSEHLAAAVSGTSTLLIQGTAGTDETALRYGWNYARLIAEGPSPAALVESPMLHGMQHGRVVRVEELTRIPTEVQDTLITILSEKTLPVPELNTEIQATRGFNVIATANNRDKGVNELSSALMRRFNTVVLPLPDSLEDEVEIVQSRAAQLGRALELPAEKPALEEIRRVVTIFRELRNGLSIDGKSRLKTPSGTLSTAEAISVISSGMAMAAYYGDGTLNASDLVPALVTTVVKDPVQDQIVWQEYLQTIVKERDGWKDLYRASRDWS